ncbi:MAG: 3-deoxy-manno-octulosonate-8-phosphatase KdsC [Methylovulum sp.]|jgi:3-deoxy-D-manno-octulosonate 8-phosphate phosphatase (KDO 8-P phosphatase)|nr:3-deoxy-manno-octulosonate-8-phosphatase KdsC [Methylovulum sp.]
MQTLIEKAKKIRLLILDVDGVLTDGKFYFDLAGNEYKSFHAQDGHGIKLLQQTGVSVAVVSGRTSISVEQRMQQLGIQHVYQGYQDKQLALTDIVSQLKINLDEIAHVGDDLLDLPIMTKVGLAIAVNDANDVVKHYADWCTQRNGGQGAVREVCDLIMQSQGHLNAIIKSYTQ